MTHATRALQSHDLSGEVIKLWITYILLWPHEDMEGFPGWVFSPMPGPPPRQHKHERQYTPSTHSVIPTRRIWNDDDDGHMIFGDLKFPDICLTGEEKPRKKPHPGNLSRSGIEPGPVAWQARMLSLSPQRWTIRKDTVINSLKNMEEYGIITKIWWTFSKICFFFCSITLCTSENVNILCLFILWPIV